MERPPRVEPEEMLGTDEEGVPGDDEEGEEGDAVDFIAANIGEAMENGLPIHFTATSADPFVLPVVRRLQRSNEIMAEISQSLRAIAILCGSKLPRETIDADLAKKPKK